jgi:predicted DNA-binding protein with PD1-like motif
MHSETARVERMIYVRADSGEDLLGALDDAVEREGIQNGAILCGVGSLSAYHVHVVGTAQLPPENTHVRGEGPFDILTVTGGILDGRVHAHLTISDDKVATGGHIHEGCTVLTFAIVLIADTPSTSLADWDTIGAWSELHPGSQRHPERAEH